MDAPSTARYQEGISGVLFSVCLLLCAIAPGILFLATNATQPAGLFAAALYILSFIFALLGLDVGVHGFRHMIPR